MTGGRWPGPERVAQVLCTATWVGVFALVFGSWPVAAVMFVACVALVLCWSVAVLGVWWVACTLADRYGPRVGVVWLTVTVVTGLTAAVVAMWQAVAG